MDVVEELAATTGVDPVELTPPLGDVVDVDALERLVEASAVSRFTFEYHGYTVTIDGDGDVMVTERSTVTAD